MEDDSENATLIEEDYYTFLNISRDASNEEINNAYRRLSRLYHPDKHVDPLQKKEAEILFNKTKRAYEVLSDPHQRAIYDSLGTRGLETEGWEIVQRTKTPQEIREEYERLARERNERKLQQRTNPKGSVIVNINATDLFNRYEDLDFDEDETSSIPIIEVSGMSFSQSIEAPLTLRDTMSLATQLDKHTVGYLTYRMGGQSSMSTVIVRDTATSHMAFSIQFGIPHSYLSLSYVHKFEEEKLKLRGSIKAGTFGAILEYGAEKKVSQHSSLAASVVVGVPSGVTLKIKVMRASQIYSFPIHLSEEVIPSPVFYATITPIIVWAVAKKLVIDPIIHKQKQRDKEKQRELNKKRLLILQLPDTSTHS
ncbi:hypothetical protein C0J52_02423 [Blattella germanica]|nr:hypothetical protein C0J52_02423 [Blattella germanica]